jgi:hypothetical protein
VNRKTLDFSRLSEFFGSHRLFWSAVINGVVAVPIMILMMLMTT